MLKPCAAPGCPNLVERGTSFCPAHKRPAWSGERAKPEGWTALRKHILVRDRGTCRMCGRKATEVDHIIPLAEGGTNDPGNLQALCRDCHHTKTVEESRRGRQRRR